VVVLPFSVAAAAVGRWQIGMRHALLRYAVGFAAALLGLFVLSAFLYAFFG
jgi:hypothetical protein